MPRLRFAACWLPGFVLLAGCVPNKIYRPGPAAIQTVPVGQGSTSPASFKLGIVEFDDMGESWEKCTSLSVPDNCQLTRVLDLIRTEKQRSGEVVVVVFVHGWKNNASPENEREKNLFEFKALMARLALDEPERMRRMALETGRPDPTPRGYIGVYIGWRGEAVRGVLDNTTFWDRRDTAQLVGSSDFAEAIYRIMGITKQDSPNSRIVVVGHSFGARALETALTNTFVSLLVPQPNGQGLVKPPDFPSPADLIMYVNSANDSFRTKQMIELMKRTQLLVTRGEDQYHGPLFLSVTSTGDSATRVAFPLGQGISALSKSFRPSYGAINSPPQKTFFTHTPGHVPYLYSHQLGPVTAPCVSTPALFRFSISSQCYELTPTPNRWNDSPFWVVTVPPAIIRDHNDIFNPSFTTMIIDLMAQYRVLDSPRATTMTRSH